MLRSLGPPLAVTLDRDTTTFLLFAGSATVATIAALIRYGLMPYLREQLDLARQTHQQVSAPADADASTMREELTEVRGQLNTLAGKVADAADEFSAMAMMFDGHLDWSQEEVDRLWAELRRQADAGERPHPRPHGPKHRGETNANGE